MHGSKNKKTVLVTGTGGRSVGSGILHTLLRCHPDVCKRWSVIAADADPFAWGLYKADKSIRLPLANDPGYIPAINTAIRQLGVDAVIPGTQPEIQVLLEHQHELPPVELIANQLKLMPLMMDKFKLQKQMQELSIPYIETKPVDQWESVVQDYSFPVVVKPTINTGASRGVHIIADQEEMKRYLANHDRNGLPCVQPYLGTPQDEYTVGVLTDKEGALIDSIVMHRELKGLSLHEARTINGRVYALSSGYSQGYIIKHPQIQSFCEDLSVRLDSRGPMNIQLRLHQGKPYVFELHPRFSGTTPIRADVNFNEVDVLLRNFLFGEKFTRLDYRFDVAAIRAFEHVIVPTADLLTKDKI